MPHRLRRIIAINIRNAKDGLPSSRIAELDPSGGVLVVGDNGVGKTTFLRLLPLFYGATPSQILRGSGRHSMINYTLPDPSSAVAFEYERESSGDVRLVVMHARPTEDAAQFFFVKSGFNEDFFLDAEGQFVTREEFKGHVEGKGMYVSAKLFMHQYRAVILNEKTLTKDPVDLRELRAEFSLGPRPLLNLAPIAAAMANEKISFSDLKNIVIERVTDASEDDTRRDNVREIKRDRKDVVRWLEDREHLARVMGRRSEGDRIRERVATIKSTHHQLSVLHVAVKEALNKDQQRSEELVHLETDLRRHVNLRLTEMNEELVQQNLEAKDAKTTWETKRDALNAAKSRQQHFEWVGAETLANEQFKEESLKARARLLEGDLEAIQNTSGDVVKRSESRKQSINGEYVDTKARVASEKTSLQLTAREREHVVREAERNALTDTHRPQRLKQIEDSKLALASRQGELSIQANSPQASKEAIKAITNAEAQSSKQDDAYKAALASSKSADTELSRRRTELSESILAASTLRSAITELKSQIEILESRLSPSDGSLMQFLRQAKPGEWRDVSKVINPDLLRRTDLTPTLVSESGDASGVISIGQLNLHVQALEVPAWVDMQEVRQDIAAKTNELATLNSNWTDEDARSRRLGVACNELDAKANEAHAYESIALDALSRARAGVQSAKAAALVEAETAGRAALDQLNVVKEEIASLVREEQILTTDHAKQLTDLMASFATQLTNIQREVSSADGRLDEELKQALVRRDAMLSAVDLDVSKELAGLGIDPHRIATVESELAELQARLASIAGNRHEVADWTNFQKETLPFMAIMEQERARLYVLLQQANQQVTNLENRITALTEEANQQITIWKNEAALIGERTIRMKALAEHALKDFMDTVPKATGQNWDPVELESKVATLRSELLNDEENLGREFRALRNEMRSKDSPVSHWLDLHEKDLPDPQIMAPHLFLCAQAQVATDWFDPWQSGPYINQIHQEMNGFFSLASHFVRQLEQFERSVEGFNRDLQKALSDTARFERFRDLTVTVRSGVQKLGFMKVLHEMKDVAASKVSTLRSFMTNERELPLDEEVNLIRAFRDILQGEGGFRVNLNEQVDLECSLVENEKRRIVRNEDEFKSISSNGNSALITAMFLIGFLIMIRGPESKVRLTWIFDEVGRFDARNLRAFLETLDHHHIDVISASPSVDPALARYFPRLSIFESNGAIVTTESHGESNVAA